MASSSLHFLQGLHLHQQNSSTAMVKMVNERQAIARLFMVVALTTVTVANFVFNAWATTSILIAREDDLLIDHFTNQQYILNVRALRQKKERVQKLGAALNKELSLNLLSSIPYPHFNTEAAESPQAGPPSNAIVKTETEARHLNSWNTPGWLNGPRLSNNQEGMDDTFVSRMMDPNLLAHTSDIVNSTICHKDSQFSKSTATREWNLLDQQLINEWERKLIYLSIHAFFHEPAWEEHQSARGTLSSNNEDQAPSEETLPLYDYECHDAKYLIAALPDAGFGAAMRSHVVNHVLMGIASDRIPLFTMNVPSAGFPQLRKKWPLASCNRRDFQCVFLPPSPCTLTMHEIGNATQADMSQLRQTGIMKEGQNDRVMYFSSGTNKPKLDHKGKDDRIRGKVYDRAMQLIERWEASSSSKIMNSTGGQKKLAVLEKAAAQIKERRTSSSSMAANKELYYTNSDHPIFQMILMYLTRPNDRARKILEARIQESIPQNHDPQEAIGLPIRGSDKCGQESTCLEFDKHMQLAKESFESADSSSSTQHRGSIILTTEDKNIFQQRLAYNASTGFALDFVVNEKDTFQGTGHTMLFKNDADDIMISSLVSLKLQMYAKKVYGNCCSNFHNLIFDFLLGGCGMAEKVTCLQETKDYNICCRWSEQDECRGVFTDFKEKMEQGREERK